MDNDLFSIYWNIPSIMCKKHGINLMGLDDYGILQNGDDKFIGEKITILYDPGYFPAMFSRSLRNNGVPQEGNLKIHLALFEKELDKAIPEKNFSGVGVIDFEHWRPIWRENWGILDKYRQLSIEIERKKHPFWSKSAIENRAIQRFEKAATRFIDETLSKAIKLRPRGHWGYYAYPYCFNFTPKNPDKKCSLNVQKDNDSIGPEEAHSMMGESLAVEKPVTWSNAEKEMHINIQNIILTLISMSLKTLKNFCF